MIRLFATAFLFVFSYTCYAADTTPTPRPSSVDLYQQCIQRMIDENQPSDKWLKSCLEANRPFVKPSKRSKGRRGGKSASEVEIISVLKKNMKGVQKCYNSLLEVSKDINLDPNGSFEPSFDVDQAGRVFNFKFNPGTLTDYGHLSCVKALVLAWKFPKYTSKPPISVSCLYDAKRNKKGKGRVVMAKGHPVVKIPSGYTDEVIKKVIIKNAVSIRKCYDSLLKRKPASDGVMETAFSVSKSGQVSKAVFTKAGIDDKRFKKCLAKRFKSWKFPPTPSGKAETVNYPLEFKLHL